MEDELQKPQNDLFHEIKSKGETKTEMTDMNSYESLMSEPPDISNWFSSYVYESPMLDTSDGIDLSDFGESECSKAVEIKKETTKVEDMFDSQLPEVVEDSDIDEDDRPSILRKAERKKVTTPNYEAEITSLKNKVRFLEYEVRILHDLINRFIRSSGNNST